MRLGPLAVIRLKGTFWHCRSSEVRWGGPAGSRCCSRLVQRREDTLLDALVAQTKIIQLKRSAFPYGPPVFEVS
jgi:hypothetical protein